MALASTLLTNIASTILIILVNAFAIWLTVEKILKYVSSKAGGFKTAFKISLIAGVISFVLGLIPTFSPALVGNAMLNLLFFVINAIVLLFLIQKFYGLKLGEAAISWLVVLVLGFVIGFVVGNITGMIMAAL